MEVDSDLTVASEGLVVVEEETAGVPVAMAVELSVLAMALRCASSQVASFCPSRDEDRPSCDSS